MFSDDVMEMPQRSPGNSVQSRLFVQSVGKWSGAVVPYAMSDSLTRGQHLNSLDTDVHYLRGSALPRVSGMKKVRA